MKLSIAQTDEQDIRPGDSGQILPDAPQPAIFGKRAAWLRPFEQPSFSGGITLLITSLLITLVMNGQEERADRNFRQIAFMVQYALTLIFSLHLLWQRHVSLRELPPGSRSVRWIGLLLWLVSAFALNRLMVVFQDSAGWLQILLVVSGAAMLAHTWLAQMSVRMQQGVYLLLAVCWWLFLYAAFYLTELYLVSLPGLLVFGLTFHTFVPLLLAWVIGKRLWVDYGTQEHLRPAILIGLVVPVLVVWGFLTLWGKQIDRLERAKTAAVMRQTDDLPEWILLAQQLQPDWLVSRMLRVGSFYDQGPFTGESRLDKLTAIDDRREHDPLVLMASRYASLRVVPEADRLKLLRLVEGNRHGSSEKFWLGRNLITQHVVTQARIWPQFRLAYTEKTVQIRNTAQQTTREALYTFHLPEGSVVSSMSLWINGREEKARLTTLAKADSAYRQVVNVESRPMPRDPAVALWQEGNQVTVRVFPCPASEDRQFRIGITSPLRLTTAQRLVYENPFFEGPDTRNTREQVRIECMQAPEAAEIPSWLAMDLNRTITYEGDYHADWTFSFKAPALSTASFVMDGKAWTLAPYVPEKEAFALTDVYLDINAAWTRIEFDKVVDWARQANRKLWVFDDGLKTVTDASAGAYFDKLSGQSFSLFPVYRIAHPETALLVTKSTGIGPVLKELDSSPFAAGTQSLATRKTPFAVFTLPDAPLSAYLKSLSELQLIQVQSGGMDALEELIRFRPTRLKPVTTPDEVALPIAGVTIQQHPVHVQQAAVAPDHLARLFIYNDIMRRVGPRFFDQSFRSDNVLVGEAERANILSPVSSLIVLETERDYNRFGIKRDQKGLENATLKNEGAVPEPHEWALLVAALLFVFIIRRWSVS